MPEGTQVITVTVSDGEFEASDYVTVVVKDDGRKEEDADGNPLGERENMVLVLSILIGTFLAIIAIVSRYWLDGGRNQ